MKIVFRERKQAFAIQNLLEKIEVTFGCSTGSVSIDVLFRRDDITYEIYDLEGNVVFGTYRQWMSLDEKIILMPSALETEIAVILVQVAQRQSMFAFLALNFGVYPLSLKPCLIERANQIDSSEATVLCKNEISHKKWVDYSMSSVLVQDEDLSAECSAKEELYVCYNFLREKGLMQEYISSQIATDFRNRI